MLDALFVGGSLALLFCLGYPLSRLLPSDKVQWRGLAAPVLGYGLFGVLITLLYRYGMAPRWGLVVVLGLAGAAFLLYFVWPWWRRGGCTGFPERRLVGVYIILSLVVVTELLPSWIGGPQFTAFQGNQWDQINYIAYSSAMRSHSFAALQALTPETARDNNYLLFAQSQLDARPTVGLAYAALATLFRTLSADGSYAYMVMMQSLMFFSASFVLINIARVRINVCAILAAGLTLGFFMQYVLDIDAWSQLATMPLMLLLFSTLVLAMEPSPLIPIRRHLLESLAFLMLITILSVSVLYYYPEILFEYGLPCGLLCVVMLVTSRFSGFAMARSAILVMAAGLAVAACLPLWAGTIGHVVDQISVATTASADWSQYFQRYLFQQDLDYASIFSQIELSWQTLYAIFSFPIEFITSAIGFYFLLPPVELPLWIAIGWKIGLLVLLVMLFTATIGMIRRAWCNQITARDSRFFIGALFTLAMPVLILLYGKYWAAGKALTMAAPLLFILFAAPVLISAPHDNKTAPVSGRDDKPAPSWTRSQRRGLDDMKKNGPRWWHAAAWLFVLGHIGFGFYRPVAVAQAPNAIPYPYPPYPDAQDASFKTDLSWDLRPWKAVLTTCRRTSLDVENPFLERYLQVMLSELGLDWSSVHPLDSYFGTGLALGLQPQKIAPDCLVTTSLEHVHPWQTVIWLGRNRTAWDFYRGISSTLDLLPSSPTINSHGLWSVEFMPDGLLRWTNGQAELTVANNPEHPASRLEIALGTMRPPGGSHLRVLVNDNVLFDGTAPSGEWSANFPLDSVAPARQLTIRIESDSFLAPNDSRTLGVPLRHLTLVAKAD